MAENKRFTLRIPVIMDGNSAIPASMSEFLGDAGRKYVKSQSYSNYQLSKNTSVFLADDEPEPEPGTITRQHWYFHRPLLNMITGGENFRIEYPDAFDDVVWEYAQGERDAAEKDVLAYASWYKNKITTSTELSISIPPSITFADNATAPLSTISAEKAGEFKKRLLQTLKGHKFETTLSYHVNDIMNRTRAASRKAGKARAKTNPVVEEVMKSVDIDTKVPD